MKLKKIILAWFDKMSRNKHGFKKAYGKDALRLKTSILANTKNGIVFNPCAYEREDTYYMCKFNNDIENSNSLLSFDPSNIRAFLKLERQRMLNAAHMIQKNKYKGGMLIFSTDVNANVSNTIIGKISGWLQTAYNNLTKKNRIRDVVDSTSKEQSVDFGVTVGKNFIGRYVSQKTGQVFDEKSLSVTILGVSSEVLYALADNLMDEFNQETVAIQDYNTGESGLLAKDEKQTE